MWDTIIIYGTVANICVHYDVVIPKDTVSALYGFGLGSSLGQTAFLFAGRIAESENIRVTV